MKNLLVTTAIVVGIGFGAQASDPSATLDQIAELVASHLQEENTELETRNAELEDRIAELERQTDTGYIEYLEIANERYLTRLENIAEAANQYGTREFTPSSDAWVLVANVFQSGWDQGQNAIAVEIEEDWADEFASIQTILNHREALIDDLQAENEVIQEWANYEITVRDAQIAALEADLSTAITQVEVLHIDVISETNPLTVTVDGNNFSWTSIENAQDELYDIIFDSLYTVSDEEFAEMQVLIHSALAEYDNGFDNYAPPLPIYVAEGVVNRIHAIVANLRNQVNSANSAAQEASNRANSNAENVAAWYNEAQRLEGVIAELEAQLEAQE